MNHPNSDQYELSGEGHTTTLVYSDTPGQARVLTEDGLARGTYWFDVIDRDVGDATLLRSRAPRPMSNRDIPDFGARQGGVIERHKATLVIAVICAMGFASSISPAMAHVLNIAAVIAAIGVALVMVSLFAYLGGTSVRAVLRNRREELL
jgi:hypothetical protein